MEGANVTGSFSEIVEGGFNATMRRLKDDDTPILPIILGVMAYGYLVFMLFVLLEKLTRKIFERKKK